MTAAPHVVVVGAGAFGGWTALHCLRRGAAVTLLDAWGPANSRASSGGETRVIRWMYGADRPYVDLVNRSFDMWRQAERDWGSTLYHRTGLLWMFGEDDAYATSSVGPLHDGGHEIEEVPLAQARTRYPQIQFDGIRSLYYEPDAGYLAARRACELVVEAFVNEGGGFRAVSALPEMGHGGRLSSVACSDGARLAADHYVFACGPWLGQLFPEVLGEIVRPTKQEVCFLGTPAGDARFHESNLPIWMDLGARRVYGLPGAGSRGFKVAEDRRGEDFDPTRGDRQVTAATVASLRRYVAFRFPALAAAPVLESRVCQYANSPDGHFIIDRLPGLSNAWIAGAGSGHGFKVGPAVGEDVSRWVLESGTPNPMFAMSRLEGAGERRTQFDRTE